MRLLLEAAPAIALAVDFSGWTPLHRAAERGDIEVMKLLLPAARDPAAMLDAQHRAPIHMAANRSNAAAVQLLLTAAPEVAFALDGSGRSPLHLVLQYGLCSTTEQVVETARCLVWAAPEVQPALGILLQHGQHSSTLFADLVAHPPLSQEQWRSIPAPCTDLARALPAVLQRSTAEAGWLVGHLAEEQRARLRAAALSMARAQLGGPSLPAELSGRILALCSP